MKNILNNLEKQKSSYTQLLDHLEKQKLAIQEQNDEALMETIKDKNELIQLLHQLEQELNQRLEKLGDQDKETAEEKTKELRQEIIHSLELLISHEEECEQALREQQKELKSQMVEFKKKKTLFKGYNDPSSSKGGTFSTLQLKWQRNELLKGSTQTFLT